MKYKGSNTNQFINGNCYDAYFLEFWQGERNSLYVKDESGEITDFNDFGDFEVISDPDNVLNLFEATVKCITHAYDKALFDLNFGNEYIAIGRDKDGFFLVMDESFDCYFYPANYFEIIRDEYGILEKESIYYSYSS